MLVLSRKPGERIVIGDGIEIVVLDARRGHVRLGFIAPHEVRIHRQEVAQKIERDEACQLAQQHLASVLKGMPSEDACQLQQLSKEMAATA